MHRQDVDRHRPGDQDLPAGASAHHHRVPLCGRGCPRCCHIHYSNPYSEMSGDDVGFSEGMDRQSAEYFREQLAAHKKRIEEQAIHLRRLSIEDALTGLYNRNKYQQDLGDCRKQPRKTAGDRVFRPERAQDGSTTSGDTMRAMSCCAAQRSTSAGSSPIRRTASAETSSWRWNGRSDEEKLPYGGGRPAQRDGARRHQLRGGPVLAGQRRCAGAVPASGQTHVPRKAAVLPIKRKSARGENRKNSPAPLCRLWRGPARIQGGPFLFYAAGGYTISMIKEGETVHNELTRKDLELMRRSWTSGASTCAPSCWRK